MGNKRLEYIDALRGIAIYLVVFSHTTFFSFGAITTVDYIASSIHLPLFFFISGFVVSKVFLSFNDYIGIVVKKAVTLILPAVIWGLLFTYTVVQHKAFDFFSETMKYGYWFTLSLYEMLFIYYSVCLLCNNHYRKIRAIALIVIAVALWGGRYLFVDNLLYGNLSKFISLWHTSTYFPFFVLGVLLSLNKEKCELMLKNDMWSFLILMSFGVLSCFNIVNSIDIEVFPWFKKIPASGGILALLLGVSGILTLYLYCLKNPRVYLSSTVIGRTLQLLGQRSLDIYLIHYFIIPNLKTFECFTNASSFVIIVLGLLIALIIVGVSLLIGSIIRSSPIMAHFLLGVK